MDNPPNYTNYMENLKQLSTSLETSLGFNFTDIDIILEKLEDNKLADGIKDLCPENNSPMSHPCSDRHLQKILAGYMYPIMLFICLTGNSLNIAVYSVEFLRRSLTVKILAARSAANCIFVSLLMFEAMKTLQLWDPQFHKDWEALYWHMWPYVVMMANIVGSTAMWITVLMTLERYLYVMYPVQSRKWCTFRNFCISLIFILLWFSVLHSLYPLTHYIEINNCTGSTYPVYLFKTRSERIHKVFERLFYWSRLHFAVFMPVSVMSFMSAAIARKLLYQRLRSHSSAEKRCITTITLMTTAAHLILESPHVVVFSLAALGTNQESEFFCTWSIVSNFLATCNASILIFIYLAFSSHFRWLLLMRLKCQPVESSNRTSILIQRHYGTSGSSLRLQISEADQHPNRVRIKSCQVENVPLLDIPSHAPRRCRSLNYASTNLCLTTDMGQNQYQSTVSLENSSENSCNDVLL